MACHFLADFGWSALTGRTWLVCYAINWQTLTGMSLADLSWHTSFPADLIVVGMPLYLPAICCQLFLLNYALQAACPLFALFPTICTIPNSQLLFPTIPIYLHYSQLFTSISNRQTLVGMPCMSRPWLAFQFPADLGCETDDWHSLVALLFFGRAWLVWY